MSEQMKKEAPKKDIFGFTKIGEDQYQSDVDPQMIVTAREFNSNLACFLAIVFGLAATVGGCAVGGYNCIQRHRVRAAMEQAGNKGANFSGEAVKDQFQHTQFHKTR